VVSQQPWATLAGKYLRLIDSCITQLKLKDLPGPVTRVKKKKLAGNPL